MTAIVGMPDLSDSFQGSDFSSEPSAISQTLLLLNSQIVTNPAHVESVTQLVSSNGTTVKRQVLDRVMAGMAPLPENHYSYIYIAPMSLDDSKQPPITLNSKALEILYASLLPGGTLSGALDFASQTLDAIMAGFIESSDKKSYIKPQTTKSVPTSIPLRRATNQGAKKKPMPMFKKMAKAAPSSVSTSSVPLKRDSSTMGIVRLSLDDLDDDGDDDLLDENTLIAQSSKLANPIIIPPQCNPGPGKKRKKACKDCTCGLRELELQEEEAQLAKQRGIVTINVDAAEEIDFTIPGKTGGSCGSCALGDAFRCDGCPYLGLPPFKPGEIVNIASIRDDF